MALTAAPFTPLSVRELACMRGERRLFSGLDFQLHAGQWLHVRGANGAGKTSLLRLLAGLSVPESGEVCWRGQSIDQADAASRYRQELLFLGHRDAVKVELSGFENLTLAAALDGAPLPPAEALTALRRLGLKGREHLPVRCLSAGQRRRVLLARLLTRKATLWVLDEPLTALDVVAVELLLTLLREHLAAGGMAVLTSHQNISLDQGQVLELSGAP